MRYQLCYDYAGKTDRNRIDLSCLAVHFTWRLDDAFICNKLPTLGTNQLSELNIINILNMNQEMRYSRLLLVSLYSIVTLQLSYFLGFVSVGLTVIRVNGV